MKSKMTESQMTVSQETVSQMTIKEKIIILNGATSWLTHDVARLGIPSVMMCDGPHGIRKEKSSDKVLSEAYKATLFPGEAAVACSFNPKTAYLMGQAIGEEAFSSGVAMVLGPGINIKRNPLCGRNFEYYSEDPYLSGIMGSMFIKGVEEKGVASCAKHFAANSQETFRLTTDSVVDERALREIYLPSFQMAVKSNVSAIMPSYNMINGVYACENKYLLENILRDEWHFTGLTVSDWGAVNDITQSIKNGLSLEMPSTKLDSAKRLYEAYNNKKISEEEIDKAVEHVLDFVAKGQKIDITKESSDDELLKKNYEVAKMIAEDSIVLLKNEQILPLKSTEKILFVGDFIKNPRVQGGGSSHINVYHQDTVYEHLDEYLKNWCYLPGYVQTGDCYKKRLVSEVTSVASQYDKIVLFIGLTDEYENEGTDRVNIDLPNGHIQLFNEIINKKPNVVVHISTGSPVNLAPVLNAKAIVNSYLLGESSGEAILNILFGKKSPSGRLPETYPYSHLDVPSSKNFANSNNAVWYEESIFVGYRYFTTFNKDVCFPFGYGLSYASFAYSDLTVDSDVIKDNIKVSVNVTNTSDITASEVVQLYIRNNESSVYKAKRELKRFDKVVIAANSTVTVTFTLNVEDFAYYDVILKKQNVDNGTYYIEICKDCNTVLLDKPIKCDTITDLKSHNITSYNNKEYLDTKDFAVILGKNPPEKNKKLKKPYTINATAMDLRSSFMGSLIYLAVKIVAKKIAKSDPREGMRKMIISSSIRMPMRSLSALSGGVITYHQAMGIIDIANGKIIKGIKKLTKR